ncbi:MAG: hydroxymethylbilane synthase, partial [Acidimicrobiales bacterium]
AELQVPGLVLAAFPERADPRDLLVGAKVSTLVAGATVATGSARRRVQLAHLRPDLVFRDLRGNMATRVAKAGVDGVVAVVVAAAGVDRLGWSPPEGVEVELLEPEVMLPQVGQGAVVTECREDDDRTRAALAGIDDPSVRRVVSAERAFLAELGGGCTLPVGAHATLDDTANPPGERIITLTGMIGSDDGRVVLLHTDAGDNPESIGRAVARYLLDDAGGNSLGVGGDQ